MNVMDYIARIDNARQGHRLSEDTTPVASAPSHAPTSTAQWKTERDGSIKDQGQPVKKAYKQPDCKIPAPVAAPPSHAPTSGKDPTTTGDVAIKDEGEKVSKEAMKEAIDDLIDGKPGSFEALISEAGHKPGCKCGFCANKGKFKKDKEASGDNGDSKDSDGDEPVAEAMPIRPMSAPHRGVPSIKRRLGGERMSFRQPSPGQRRPAMEQRQAQPRSAIQRLADSLLDYPR